MNVIQRPGSIEFASTMPDYIIETEVTINFSVQYQGKTILSEEYVPDGNYQVRIRKLGKFCMNALWGKWPDTDTYSQSAAAGTFSFLINGSKDTDTFLLFSRFQVASRSLLSMIQEKVTRPGAAEWCNFIMKNGENLTLAYTEDMVQWATQQIYTHSSTTSVVSINASLKRVETLTGKISLCAYEIRHSGGEKMTFLVDKTSYLDCFCFRFLNNFDLPESVTTVGILTLKGGDESETGLLYGVTRKFEITPGDEYTANSGVIFSQADYRLWRDFLNTRQAEIYSSGTWLPIVITKQNYEREFRRNKLKAVEFNFQMADPEQNGLIEL